MPPAQPIVELLDQVADIAEPLDQVADVAELLDLAAGQLGPVIRGLWHNP